MNTDATFAPSQAGPPDATTQLARFKLFARRTLRFWWIVVITLLFGGLSCAIFFLVRTPRYLSETVILFSEGIPATGEPRGPPDQNAAIRLRETLYSRPKLEKIILKFDLYPEIRESYGMVDAVDEFREDIGFRAPGSDTYTISYKGISPAQAQKVTEALAASLIEEESSMRRTKTSMTRDFLAREHKRTEQELKATETALAEFLSKHPSFALDSMLLMPGAPPTGAAIRAAEAEQSAMPAPAGGGGPRYYRPRSAAGGGLIADAGFRVPEELAAERTRSQAAVAAARTDLSQKLARFTDHHPDVQAARGTLERAQQRLESINAAIASASAGAQSHAAALRAAQQRAEEPKPVVRRGAPARAAPEKPEKKMGSEKLVELETQWSRLTRKLSEARSRHEQIETSFFKADINANSADGGNAIQMMVVDPAYLPLKTTPPGPITWVGIFMMLSLIMGGGLAVGRAAVDDRVLDSLDLAGLGPVLTEISRPGTSSAKRRRSHD